MVPPLPVAFVLAVVAANLLYVYQILPAKLPEEVLREASASEFNGGALVSDGSLAGLTTAEDQDEVIGYALVDRSSFLNPSTLSSEVTPEKPGLLTYTVEKGDTVSTIAEKFGIPQSAILSANSLGASGKIKAGDEIVILPVAGAEKAKAKAESKKEKKVDNAPKAAKSAGYFISPLANGLNWGKLHDGNAVDIAAACGTSIRAAAAGTVTEVGSPSNWNSGYGGLIRISHANGTKTLYGHNSVNLVSVGDEVAQGSIIAKVGRTGEVSGITGCHVHFGVSGTRNPFAR